MAKTTTKKSTKRTTKKNIPIKVRQAQPTCVETPTVSFIRRLIQANIPLILNQPQQTNSQTVQREHQCIAELEKIILRKLQDSQVIQEIRHDLDLILLSKRNRELEEQLTFEEKQLEVLQQEMEVQKKILAQEKKEVDELMKKETQKKAKTKAGTKTRQECTNDYSPDFHHLLKSVSQKTYEERAEDREFLPSNHKPAAFKDQEVIAKDEFLTAFSQRISKKLSTEKIV